MYYSYPLNISWYIAKRMLKQEKGAHRYARPVMRISVWSIALGIAVMILSVAIVTGFQQEIRNKVIGFGSHIQITAFNSNESLETNPVPVDQEFYPELNEEPEVKNIHIYALKPAMMQSQTQDQEGNYKREIQGVVTKGISTDYDTAFLSECLVEGRLLHLHSDSLSNEILISQTQADRLKLKIDDTVFTYFINNNAPRERRFRIVGIYHSGMDEYDKQFVFIDINHIRKLNAWGIEAMCYVRNDVKDDYLIIEAAGKGGGNYLYDFGGGYSSNPLLLIKPGRDTIIRVVVSQNPADDPFNVRPGEEKINYIPDTAWLQLSYYPKIVPGMEFELMSNPEVESAGDTHFVYHHPGLNVIAKMHNSGGSSRYYTGGFEVLLNHWDDLEKADDFIYKHIGPEFKTKTIKELNPDLFQWLSYLNINVWVILTLMLLVSLINMCSTLLVMILERTNMIGLLKALGGDNAMLQKTFFYNGAILIGKGLVIGNILGVGLAMLQHQTGFLGLDQSTYFIDTVPIYLNPLHILLLNAGTLVICLVTLLLPAWFVSRISPIKAIRFD